MIDESAIEFEGEEVNEEEIVDEFRKFLDDVSPISSPSRKTTARLAKRRRKPLARSR